jgi:dihydrofolate reductase
MPSQVVYYTAATLDGYLADERHSLDWLFAVDDAVAPDLQGFGETVGAYVSGSSTYEWVLEHENLIDEPEKWEKFYAKLPWFVFTSRELPVPEGADVRFVNGTPAQHFDAINAAAGEKNVWLYGGGDLVGQFFEAGLLDRIEVSITPVTLGAGAPLLPRRIESDRLRLESVTQYGQFAHLIYNVIK